MNDGNRAVIDRPTARVILLDPSNRVLLFQYHSIRVHDPALPVGAVQPTTSWATPGGGLLAGESFLDGAKRELWEETGIKDAVFGPVVLEREKLVHFDGVPILGRERYFVARTRVTEISLENQEDLERSDYRDHRWWTLAELESTVEVIFPEGFAALVRAVIEGAGKH